jgi:hypothetical protein
VSNPFEAVIKDLRWIINISDAATFAENEEIEQAIRVLEASGKVDKRDALHTIRDYSGGTWEPIRDLFSALPGGEK